MKKLFCKMFLIVGLCLGFSVHSQEQESEWVTCLLENGDCKEFKKIMVLIEYKSEYVSVYEYSLGTIHCLYEHYKEGRKCLEIKRQQNRNQNQNQ